MKPEPHFFFAFLSQKVLHWQRKLNLEQSQFFLFLFSFRLVVVCVRVPEGLSTIKQGIKVPDASVEHLAAFSCAREA